MNGGIHHCIIEEVIRRISLRLTFCRLPDGNGIWPGVGKKPKGAADY